jgi:uncharacterized membrane protein YcaP (DUF421 family)
VCEVPRLRQLLRQPRALVRDGVAIPAALQEEAVSDDELLAGLRKLGYASIEDVKLAVLEEAGHISAVPRSALSDDRRLRLDHVGYERR